MSATYSIIIPLLDPAEQAFVEGVTADLPFELVELIVAGTSTPGHRALCADIGARLVETKPNPACALKGGCAEARGEVLIVIDPSLTPQKGWFDLLTARLAEQPDAIVAAASYFADGRVRESGVIVWADATLTRHGEGAEPTDPRFRFTRVADAATAALAFRRETYLAAGGFSAEFESYAAACADLCIAVEAQGGRVIVCPKVKFTVPGRSDGWPASLDERRPAAVSVPSERRSRVLVLGIYLAEKPTAVADVVARIKESETVDVDQRWVALGAAALPEVADVTVRVVQERTPKFQLLNELLAETPLNTYDYVVVCDDDIVCPHRFLDSLLGVQEKYGFALAQPARTEESYTDHPIVEAHRGLLARRTQFVEIGPVFSIHSSAFDVLLPFDMRSPMGWGYEQIWAYEALQHGWSLGIIDGCPVDHGLRKPVANYAWRDAKQQQLELLATRPHLPLDVCLTVTDVIPRQGTPNAS